MPTGNCRRSGRGPPRFLVIRKICRPRQKRYSAEQTPPLANSASTCRYSLMATSSDKVQIVIADEHVDGTFLTPHAKVPGILFVHGWGGSEARDLERARGIAGLGCVCLTFDLRAHEKGSDRQKTVTREENLRDLIAAYDLLIQHPAIDT